MTSSPSHPEDAGLVSIPLVVGLTSRFSLFLTRFLPRLHLHLHGQE